jgi:cation transport regulator
MPYKTLADLPDAVRKHLPKHAQEIYKEAFNNAYQQYAQRKDRDAVAHKVAWSAVKKQYEKHEDRWVKKITK